MFLKQLAEVLERIPNEGEGWTIVDVFGGSGLLAHTAKKLKPKARVIYNDFDNYSERLKHIDDTNRLRQILAKLVEGIPRESRLEDSKKAEIIKAIEDFAGYKDLRTIMTWFSFSGGQFESFEKLYSVTFWNNLAKNDYQAVESYLEGVEIISESFLELIPKFEAQEKTLLLLDPPYICTKQESYRQKHYFDLVSFVKLINLVKPPYVFFSSVKSEFVRFIDAMISEKWQNWQTFANAERIEVKANINNSRSYQDNMVYKF